MPKSDAEIERQYEEVRDRIFTRLQELKISQKELAAELGLPPQTVTDWKKGKSNSFLRYLPALSKILKQPFGWLLSGGEYLEFLSQREAIPYFPISEDEKNLLQAYRAADSRAKDMVTLALEPWLRFLGKDSEAM